MLPSLKGTVILIHPLDGQQLGIARPCLNLISVSLLSALSVSHKRIFNNYLMAVSADAFQESISMVLVEHCHPVFSMAQRGTYSFVRATSSRSTSVP